MADQLGIQKQEDWYSLQGKELREYGLIQVCITVTANYQQLKVLHLHGGSLPQTLQAAYPEFEWKVWKFQRLPQHWYSDFNKQKEYIEWLSEELQLKTLGN